MRSEGSREGRTEEREEGVVYCQNLVLRYENKTKMRHVVKITPENP